MASTCSRPRCDSRFCNARIGTSSSLLPHLSAAQHRAAAAARVLHSRVEPVDEHVRVEINPLVERLRQPLPTNELGLMPRAPPIHNNASAQSHSHSHSQSQSHSQSSQLQSQLKSQLQSSQLQSQRSHQSAMAQAQVEHVRLAREMQVMAAVEAEREARAQERGAAAARLAQLNAVRKKEALFFVC